MPEVTESRPPTPPASSAVPGGTVPTSAVPGGTVPSGAELPLDTDEADRAADEALGLKLGTTTRTEIDDCTQMMRGQVSLFASAVREGGGVEARGSGLEADQLLDSGPADGCLVFNAWTHLRDLARLLRRLVAEYRKRVADDTGALPVRAPAASPNGTAPGCSAPRAPGGPAPAPQPVPVASEQ